MKTETDQTMRKQLEKLCYQDSSGIWYVKSFTRDTDILALLTSTMLEELEAVDNLCWGLLEEHESEANVLSVTEYLDRRIKDIRQKIGESK